MAVIDNELEERNGESAENPSLRARQRRDREDAILDAAQGLMQEVGYETMTMDDLAARAGISKPTLYGHFASKEEIAVRAVVRTMRRGLDQIAALDPNMPPIARLEAILRQFFHNKYVAKTAFVGAAREALGPAIRQHPDYCAKHGRVVTLLSEVIEKGKAVGEINPRLSTRIAVQSILSIFRDTEYEDLLQRGETQVGEMTDTLVTLLINGMRA